MNLEVESDVGKMHFYVLDLKILTNQTGVELVVSHIKTELIAFTPIEIVFSSKLGV